MSDNAIQKRIPTSNDQRSSQKLPVAHTSTISRDRHRLQALIKDREERDFASPFPASSTPSGGETKSRSLHTNNLNKGPKTQA